MSCWVTMKAFIVILGGFLLIGCPRMGERYEATFIAVVCESDVGEVTWYSEAPQWGLAVNMAIKVLESRQFLERYLKPRLPESLANDTRVREGLRISGGEYRVVGKRLLAEIKIEAGVGGEVVFDAVLAGFEQIMKDRTLLRLEERGKDFEKLLKDAKSRGDVPQQQALSERISSWVREKSDSRSIHNGRFVLEVKKP